MSKCQTRTRRVLICVIIFLMVVLFLCIAVLTALTQDRNIWTVTKETAPKQEERVAFTKSTLTERIEEESIEQITADIVNVEEQHIDKQPPALTRILEDNCITYETLKQQGCSQLITVISNGTLADISFYSCDDGIWGEKPALFEQGYVGRNGVCTDKQEGDGCTPCGLYGIGSCFYIEKVPNTKLDVFQISNDTYWVDDPDSVFYNQRVEGTDNKDWKSAEHMIRYDVYRYGFVIEYNLLAEYQAGSAIFFHVGNNPTAGCIATDEETVLAYLAELDKERNPYILIASGENLRDTG